MVKKKPLLICIIGPTAIGKTSLSIKIAKAFSAEIVSADSRQFYKEMNIGTAVPSKEELASTTHHFIQNKSIQEPYSIGDFEKDALITLKSLFKKNNVAVMVGGSGLYVDAVTKGLDVFPDVKPGIREQLNEEFKKNGIQLLQEELKIKDPTYYEKVDSNNPHRVIRALEICRSAKLPYSSFLKKEKPPRFFNTLYIGLTADRKIIYDRINQRVDIMIQEGLVAEVETLIPYQSLNALQTVGYRELFAYFKGAITLEKAIDEIKKNTRRFAKRQGTWYRKNKEVTWFDYSSSSTEIVAFITKNS